MNKHIDDSLDMVPLNDVYEPEPVEKRVPTQQDNDYEYARENFYNVIEKGTEALEDMLNVARASEHPRAYEVVSTLMKTLVDANKDLVAMGNKKAQDEQPEDKKVTNNNLFVGSTAELQQLLKDMRNGDD
jgi:ABC-type proline/glycine betaine transport system substrate-binding protein